MDALDWRTTRVPSSNIRRVAYDEANRQMVVEFNSGKRYAYPRPTARDMLAIQNADSPGAAFSVLKKTGVLDEYQVLPVDTE